MARRRCECGCADTIKPVHRRYLPWEMWVKINQQSTYSLGYSSSEVFQREATCGKEWIKKNIGDINIDIEMDNWNRQSNQPENTVQMIFYITEF